MEGRREKVRDAHPYANNLIIFVGETLSTLIKLKAYRMRFA